MQSACLHEIFGPTGPVTRGELAETAVIATAARASPLQPFSCMKFGQCLQNQVGPFSTRQEIVRSRCTLTYWKTLGVLRASDGGPGRSHRRTTMSRFWTHQLSLTLHGPNIRQGEVCLMSSWLIWTFCPHIDTILLQKFSSNAWTQLIFTAIGHLYQWTQCKKCAFNFSPERANHVI